METISNASYDGITGSPSTVENTSEAESSSTPGQLEPGTFILSPDGKPSTRNQVQVYSVQVEDGNPEKRKFVPINVVDKIVEKYSLGAFAGTNYSTKSTTPHHLVVHNQKQLDVVNWQIENGYIGKDMLKSLELFFEPKDVQRLPISLTSLTLHCHRNLSAIELENFFNRLPKLEAIEFGSAYRFCSAHFKILSMQSNLKKICFNDDFYYNAESREAFLSLIIENKNLHALQFESENILPPGGVKTLADSNIQTLKLISSVKSLDDCKILLGSKTLKSLDLQLSKGYLENLKEEIRNCEINNLNLRNRHCTFGYELFDCFANSNGEIGEKKINLHFTKASKRDALNWVLEPKLFQDVSIDFDQDLDISEKFFKQLMAHPGRVRVILSQRADSKVYEQEWGASLAQCHTLRKLSTRGTRRELENFVGHPSLTILRLYSFEADCLELLAKIPFLTSLYLGSGLTGETAKSLENNHTITRIGIKKGEFNDNNGGELTDNIAKSFAAMPKLRTVDLSDANLLSQGVQGELALKKLLAAKHITKIYLNHEHRDLFSNPELAELLRNSSAGRIQFWEPIFNYRLAGPELPPVYPAGSSSISLV